MKSYLKVAYPVEEYSEKMYPQKLCNYISQNYFRKRAGKLLDVGCGRGYHLVGFQRCGYEVYGLDKSPEASAVLKDITIKQCDIEKNDFPYEDNTFDWVFCKSVMEHIGNTDHHMQETLRVLKPRGRVVLMTPDWRSQKSNLFDDYTIVRAFTKRGLRNLMIIHGFENIKVSLILQLPLIWKYPYLGFIPKAISLLPDSLKWRDYEETNPRKIVRFSKEKMLLGVGEKPNG